MIDILDILSPHRPFVFNGGLAPTVASCSPNMGTTAGGTRVNIIGSNFLDGATVTFGGQAATGVIVYSAIHIECLTPLHPQGAVNVVVTNTDTQSGTLVNGYTYVIVIPTARGRGPSLPYMDYVTKVKSKQGSSKGGLM